MEDNVLVKEIVKVIKIKTTEEIEDENSFFLSFLYEQKNQIIISVIDNENKLEVVEEQSPVIIEEIESIQEIIPSVINDIVIDKRRNNKK